jgi:hypothetical protein
MKYLKSFNQINESIFTDFTSQSKPYWDLEDIEFDYIRDELDDVRGRHTITDREKSKIERILNVYLHTEVTGMKISDINTPAYGQDHCIDLQYEGCIIKPCDISVYCYEDDYFVLHLKIPISTPNNGRNPQYIVMDEFFYVIDGWDGLEEWVEKTSPYTQNQEMYKLLKSPLKDLRPTDYIEVSGNNRRIYHPDGLLNNLMKNYPYIRGWGARTFHFFDPSRGGEHFCRVEVRGTTRQREYYYDDGTLLDDGTRSRKLSNK